MTNNGPIPVNYRWSFRTQDASGSLVPESRSEFQTGTSDLSGNDYVMTVEKSGKVDVQNQQKESIVGGGDAVVEFVSKKWSSRLFI